MWMIAASQAPGASEASAFALRMALVIPWLAAVGAVLAAICTTHRKLRRLASWFVIAGVGLAFLTGVLVNRATAALPAPGHVVEAFQWIHAGAFEANFAWYLDGLTSLMLYVVTGIGLLVTIYAAGYMKGDKGFARFFAGVGLFIFAMTTLVMADNLLLLYLGWEGVGLCSYLLIGHYFQKPSAVAAAKKAFIVNRVGDLGFALGIMLTYVCFGTIEFAELFAKLRQVDEPTFAMQVIPFLLMLGAFGKSAQIPLYVWLPDAMEGPTPVSALIHAATMVTSGVYLIARLLPLFALSEWALPTVCLVGGVTSIFAASIATMQTDLKRVFAYSTVSQLGYMFMGVGALAAGGAVFHLLTHAFFKALLFLTAGSVMHAMAGQLDLRRMSGLRRRLPVTCWLMFIGCLALAGFPLTSGYFSKDLILASTLHEGLHGPEKFRGVYMMMGIVGVITAFITAYYAFRVWFRVFMGPESYEMGEEHHGDEGDEDDHGHDDGHGHAHVHEPHEVSWFMNAPLVVLAIGSLGVGLVLKQLHWVDDVIAASSASLSYAELSGHAAEKGAKDGGGWDIHTLMYFVSALISALGILTAMYFHWFNRDAASGVGRRLGALGALLRRKYFVDEAYDLVIVRPLRLTGDVLFLVDRLIVETIVDVVGTLPRLGGLAVRPLQNGVLQGYGLGMLVGTAAVVALVLGRLAAG
jgi:NADH-quinone oxidoreductase subunit L